MFRKMICSYYPFDSETDEFYPGKLIKEELNKKEMELERIQIIETQNEGPLGRRKRTPYFRRTKMINWFLDSSLIRCSMKGPIYLKN